MKYTLEDLYAGMKLRCTDSKGYSFWTTNKIYEVIEKESGLLCIFNDDGNESWGKDILVRLNGNTGNAEFEVFRPYTTDDLYEGMKILCTTSAKDREFIEGQVYTVNKSRTWGYYIRDRNGFEWTAGGIVRLLNGATRAMFKVVEKEKKTEYTEKDVYLGMKLRCTDSSNLAYWGIDRVYEVTFDKQYGLVIAGEGGRSHRTTEYIVQALNGEAPVKFEVVEQRSAKENILAMVNELTVEAGNLINERDRIDAQVADLMAETRRLKGIVREIEKFE